MEYGSVCLVGFFTKAQETFLRSLVYPEEKIFLSFFFFFVKLYMRGVCVCVCEVACWYILEMSL